MNYGDPTKIAAALGMSPQALNAYLSGIRTPRPERAKDLAKACHDLGYQITPADWVFGRAKEVLAGQNPGLVSP